MLASNPTGVAVQLVKWYQCVAVYWQLNDRHHIQIFKAVALDSYVIFSLNSRFFSPKSYHTVRYIIFPHYLLTVTIFRRNIFVTKSVLIFCTTFRWNIFIVRKVERELIKNIRQSSCQTAVFLSDLRETWIFLTCSKNIQVPSFMKFLPCVQTDRQTWRS
jgi:hypothetical protein